MVSRRKKKRKMIRAGLFRALMWFLNYKKPDMIKEWNRLNGHKVDNA